jgi:hypothetical protein
MHVTAWGSASVRALLLPLALLLPPAKVPADVLVYRDGGERITVRGQIVAKTDVELLFVLRDGRMIHLNDLSQVVTLKRTEEPFSPVTRAEMSELLVEEFGPEFKILETPHYLICYNCRLDYARDCARLLENLHRAFTNYFKVRGFKVEEPQFPLAAVVFGSSEEFKAYAAAELKESFHDGVVGFYSFITNRVAMYDMPGKGASNRRRAPQHARDRRQVLDATVATIIHEAVHQLAYNTGFHRRFSETPLWFAEGLAMYFEAPTRRAGVWRGIGAVNRLRMPIFRDHYVYRHKRLDIAALVRDDSRLRDPDTAELAYAEAWALTYFLLKKRRNQFCKYLEVLRQKPPLGLDPPEQRLADFKAAFGDDLDKLALAVITYMRSLR